MAAEKKAEGKGASGKNGPHEAQTERKADCAGLKNLPEVMCLYTKPLTCFQ